MNQGMFRVALMCFSLLTGCGGGGGDASAPNAQTESSRMSVMAASTPDAAATCSNCILGPLTLVRATGNPKTSTLPAAGDPQADYVADINDNGSAGADEQVVLDGAVLLAARTGSSSEPRHVLVNIKLTAQSVCR